MSWSTFELRVRLAPWNWFKPSSKIFYWPLQGGTSFVDLLRFFCLVFVMPLCVSVYLCLSVVTCWERAGTWLYPFLIFAPLLTFISSWLSKKLCPACLSHTIVLCCSTVLSSWCGLNVSMAYKPLYNDPVCSKLSLTSKWICCYKEMLTSTRFLNHNHLVKEN